MKLRKLGKSPDSTAIRFTVSQLLLGDFVCVFSDNKSLVANITHSSSIHFSYSQDLSANNISHTRKTKITLVLNLLKEIVFPLAFSLVPSSQRVMRSHAGARTQFSSSPREGEG